MRILLIEDHADTLHALCKLLAAEGHLVTGAATHAEALRLCRSKNFDLLICDVGLPDGDGWDLAEVARECGIRAIALTGYGMPADLAHSEAAGFAAHLTKPVTFQALRTAISDLSAA